MDTKELTDKNLHKGIVVKINLKTLVKVLKKIKRLIKK